MSLHKTIVRLLAVGFTSAAIVPLSSVAAQAASFDLRYDFEQGESLSVGLHGNVGDNGNNVFIRFIETAQLKDSQGNVLDFLPGDVGPKAKLADVDSDSKLTLDNSAGFVSTDGFDLASSPVGFSVDQGPSVDFINLVYQSSQGNTVQLSEKFNIKSFFFSKRDIPENSSPMVLLTGLAGMGLLVAKKQSRKLNA